jgi:hypothetical protein
MFILDPDFLPIPDPGIKKARKSTGSRIRNTDPGYSPDVAIPYFYTNLPVPRVKSQIPKISRIIISPCG